MEKCLGLSCANSPIVGKRATDGNANALTLFDAAECAIIKEDLANVPVAGKRTAENANTLGHGTFGCFVYVQWQKDCQRDCVPTYLLSMPSHWLAHNAKSNQRIGSYQIVNLE